MPPRTSRCFKLNFVFLKIFGIWSGNKMRTYYKYYSAVYIFISLIIYVLLLTLNLFYTPRTIEAMIREFIFYFTEVAVTAKVVMVISKRKKIINVLNLLDCDTFQGEDVKSRAILESHVAKYNIYWNVYVILCNFTYFIEVVVPVILYLTYNTTLDLPVCKYYFLSHDFIQKYFNYLYLYQAVWIFGHMTYNVNIDTLIVGFILMPIAQFKMLTYTLKHFDAVTRKSGGHSKENEISQLNRYLKHYNILLSYCSEIQDILSVTLFVQFGTASAVICVILFGLILPKSTQNLFFMVLYFFAMTLPILVSAYLGSLLSAESEQLVFAGYCCGWISRSKAFKNNLIILLTRANRKISIIGLKVFPLSLDTFVWIMKTAYSFLTLIRNVHNQQHPVNEIK